VRAGGFDVLPELIDAAGILRDRPAVSMRMMSQSEGTGSRRPMSVGDIATFRAGR